MARLTFAKQAYDHFFQTFSDLDRSYELEFAKSFIKHGADLIT